MRFLLFFLLLVGLLHAQSVKLPLLSINKDEAIIEGNDLKVGMGGFVVRAFDGTHSSIIANVKVKSLDTINHKATLSLSRYDGLHQDALPSGSWKPQPNDTVVINYDSRRALVIAPNDETYDAITKNTSYEWSHPDLFATFLSYEGHQTPLVKDFHDYCTSNSIGVLMIQDSDTLFTLDCKTFTVLDIKPLAMKNTTFQKPFYSRLPMIRGAWWGEGSSPIKDYTNYYLEQIALNNPKNVQLHELYKVKFSGKSSLLQYFNVEEQK